MDKKERHRLWKREWRKRNPDKVIANRIKHSSYMKEYIKTYYPKNVYKISKRHSDQRKIYAKFIVAFFGGKCVRCGFDDIRALQMDHTYGRNGEKRIGNIDARYKFVRDFPEEARAKYQLLCANCNWIKRDEMGEHRRSKHKVYS